MRKKYKVSIVKRKKCVEHKVVYLKHKAELNCGISAAKALSKIRIYPQHRA